MIRLASRKSGTFGLFFAVALLFVLFGCGGSPASGEPDNFRNIKWGTDFSSLSGFNQIAKDGELAFYEKNNDTLQLEDLKLEQVIYGFHKGRFYTAMIYFPVTGFSRMKEIMVRGLGEPTSPDKTPSKLVWDGSNVTVLLTSAEGSDTARLAYLYKPVQLEIELKK
ncbi:MAG: hypothetical protein WAW37_03645 [Syntrophobacteraceae bacterium]